MKKHLFTVILLTLLSAFPNVWAQDPMATPANGSITEPENQTTDRVDDGEELQTPTLTNDTVKKEQTKDAKASYPKSEPKISASGPARLELKKSSVELPPPSPAAKKTVRVSHDEHFHRELWKEIHNAGVIGQDQIGKRIIYAAVETLKAAKAYVDRKFEGLWWWCVLLSILFLGMVLYMSRQNQRITQLSAQVSRLLGRRP